MTINVTQDDHEAHVGDVDDGGEGGKEAGGDCFGHVVEGYLLLIVAIIGKYATHLK